MPAGYDIVLSKYPGTRTRVEIYSGRRTDTLGVDLPEHDTISCLLILETSTETLPHNRRVLGVKGAGSQASNDR